MADFFEFKNLTDFEKYLIAQHGFLAVKKLLEIEREKAAELQDLIDQIKDSNKLARTLISQREELKTLRRQRTTFKELWEKELSKNITNN